MRRQNPRRQAQLALRDPALGHRNHVVVDEEHQQRGNQAVRTFGAVVHVAQRDGQQGQDQQADGDIEAPGQLAARIGIGAFQQSHRAQLAYVLLARLGFHFDRVQPYPVAVELDDAVFRLSGFALVAPALAQHQEARAVLRLLLHALGGHHHPQLAAVPGLHEHVAHRPGQGIQALDEKHALAALGLGKDSGHDHGGVVAAEQLGLVRVLLVRGPGNDAVGQQHQDQGQRQGEDQHRPDPVAERQAGAEPDRHLVVAPVAHQRQHRANEDRHRQQHRQIVQQTEAEIGEYRLVGEFAAGGLAQQTDKQRHQRDGDEDDERSAARKAQFLQQRAPIKHGIFWGEVLTIRPGFAKMSAFSLARIDSHVRKR